MLTEIIFSDRPWNVYESGNYETVLYDHQKLKHSLLYIFSEVLKKQ